jgi:YggT family protein
MMTERERIIEEEVVHTPAGDYSTTVDNRSTYIPSESERRLATLERVKQVIYFIASAIGVLILMRFVLLMLGANPANGFANFIYTVSAFFVRPFLSLFGGDPQYGNSVFEFSSLVAIAVYFLVAWGIAKLFTLLYAPPDPTGRSYE